MILVCIVKIRKCKEGEECKIIIIIYYDSKIFMIYDATHVYVMMKRKFLLQKYRDSKLY